MSEMSNNMKRWVAEAKEKGAVYVLDVCDSFDYDHYPIYIMSEDKLQETVNEYNGKDMQSVYGTYKVEETHLIKDKKLRELYNFFNGFEGSEEFYVGDIKEIIEKKDKED